MVPSNEFRGLYLDGTTFSATDDVVYNLVVVSPASAHKSKDVSRID